MNVQSHKSDVLRYSECKIAKNARGFATLYLWTPLGRAYIKHNTVGRLNKGGIADSPL